MTIINVPGTHTYEINCKFLRETEVEQDVARFVKYHFQCESYKVYRKNQIICIEFTNNKDNRKNEILWKEEYGTLLSNVLSLYKEIDDERNNA